MLDAEGQWAPDLFPKQQEALAACLPNKKNIILLSGPRFSSKTWVCQHAVCQHAWNTKTANICILSVTQSVGIDSGIWEHLTEKFLPDWIENGNFGMEWIRKPYVQGVTKKPACIVSNAHGTRCKISLESLKNEDEVEERFKGKEYSMIWVNELSKFKKRKTLDTLKFCLRGHDIADTEYLFLADTNPDLDFGDKSWIYILWYLTRTASPDELKDIWPDTDPADLIPLQKRLKLIEFTVDDNHWMTPEKKADLRSSLAHDQALMDAYYWGKWVTASTDALFYRQFRPLVHVFGEAPSAKNPNPDEVAPTDECSELFCGWDPGDSVNSAAVIAERQFCDVAVKGKKGEQIIKHVPVFTFLDELVVVGETHSIDEFVIEFMKKMQFWEEIIGRPKLRWTHWSDRSVFERLATESRLHLYKLIYNTSLLAIEQGVVDVSSPIILQAADRSPGSIIQRVDLWRKLLFENRLRFSKSRCPKLIAANSGLKPGKSQVAVIQVGSPHKHPWDAGSYLVSSECHDELAKAVNRQRANERRLNEPSTLVSIPL